MCPWAVCSVFITQSPPSPPRGLIRLCTKAKVQHNSNTRLMCSPLTLWLPAATRPRSPFDRHPPPVFSRFCLLSKGLHTGRDLLFRWSICASINFFFFKSSVLQKETFFSHRGRLYWFSKWRKPLEFQGKGARHKPSPTPLQQFDANKTRNSKDIVHQIFILTWFGSCCSVNNFFFKY